MVKEIKAWCLYLYIFKHIQSILLLLSGLSESAKNESAQQHTRVPVTQEGECLVTRKQSELLHTCRDQRGNKFRGVRCQQSYSSSSGLKTTQTPAHPWNFLQNIIKEIESHPLKTLLSSNQTSCLPLSLNYDKEMTYIPKQGFPNEKLPPSHDLFKYNMYSNCCKSLGLGLQVYPLETLVRLIHYNYFPALLQETRK